MLVLGIESSCDETGIALYDTYQGLLAHALHSQIEMHAEYGGVVPELASRDHIRRVLPLIQKVLDTAKRRLKDIEGIAYTKGPGLSGALLVGTSVAESLAFTLPVNNCLRPVTYRSRVSQQRLNPIGMDAHKSY